MAQPGAYSIQSNRYGAFLDRSQGTIHSMACWYKLLVNRLPKAKPFVGIICLLSLFIIRYDGYYWNPCNNIGCFTINCPGPRGCYTPAATIHCETKQCVEDTLNERGTDHLNGVYEVDLDNMTVEKLKIINKISVD